CAYSALLVDLDRGLRRQVSTSEVVAARPDALWVGGNHQLIVIYLCRESRNLSLRQKHDGIIYGGSVMRLIQFVTAALDNLPGRVFGCCPASGTVAPCITYQCIGITRAVV